MRRLLLLTPVLALAACGDNQSSTSCVPGCAGDRTYDAVAYALRARFDAATSRLIAHEDVTLILGPRPVIELDAQVAVEAVHAGDLPLSFTTDGAGHLTIDLTALAQPAPISFTIDYQAGLSGALLAAGPRDDDPAHATLIYTDSEPDRGPAWLPAKHDPSDRATWAVELTVAADDDVIANGERVRDERGADGRIVGYALAEPIPTYLMAFAAGGLAHTERTTGRVPLALWYRKDLAIDPAINLDAVEGAMASFEALLGPYPWARYSVVLLPNYGGGMENATITFNDEASGLSPSGFALNAHELGHHWYGDWVTMRGYDDVWIKEGMATLLESEAQRGRRDRAGVGRGFGADFGFLSGDAIVDPSLRGLAKYTTGPYQRAAWLITQVRSLVGEDAFWATLRADLAAHALDSLDGPTFLHSFEPALSQDQLAALLAALPVAGAPSMTVAVAPTATGTEVTATLDDPDHTVVAPLKLTVIDGFGDATTTALTPGVPLTRTVPTGGYLAPDEADVHPPWWALGYFTEAADLGPLERPGPGTVAAFTARSAAVQERALRNGALPSAAAADVTALAARLTSTEADAALDVDACAALAAAPDRAALAAALTPLLRARPLVTYQPALAACPADVAVAAIGADLTALAATVTPTTAPRLEYFMSFDLGAMTLATLAPIASGAPTLRLRDRALRRLVDQADPGSGFGYPAVPATEVAAWREVFRRELPRTTSETRLRLLWRAVRGLADVDALPLIAPLLQTVTLRPGSGAQLVCDAWRLTGGATAAWTAFTGAAPLSTLPADVVAALTDPATQCPARRRLGRPPATTKPR